MAARKTADWPAPARPSPDQQRCLISTVRTELKLNPFGAALGVLAMGALILSGCGNGSNASTANEASSTTRGLSVKGAPVATTADSVGKTPAGAWASGKGNDLVLNTMAFYKPTQTGAYPIV